MVSSTEVSASWLREASTLGRDAAAAYLADAHSERAVYRLSRAHAAGYPDQSLLVTADSERADLAILPAVTGVVLPTPVARRLRDIGPLLHSAVTACADLVPADDRARRFVSVGEKAEAIGLSARVRDTASIADWVRVDYVLADRGGVPTPVIVDINLMPGMTHTTAAVAALHRRHLLPAAPQLREQIESLHHYDIAPVDRMRETYAAAAGTDRVHFVVRRSHGLEPDVRSAAASLTQRGRVRGVVVYADDMSAINPARPSVVVRQARTTTKHLDPSVGEAERAALTDMLEQAAAGTLHCYPGPHIYMESHAWPHFMARDPYQAHLRRTLGEQDYALLLNALAPTAIIEDGALRWPDGTTEPITADALTRCVIKRGSSTGSEGVEVLAGNRGRRAYRQRAAHALAARAEPGWVVQRYIDSPKQTHVVLDSTGSTRTVTGYVRYGAYFAAGEYIGGYALLSAESRMVHGGSATHWLTIAEATE
ncbi:hypothetical protein [Nocardia vermiculata]|uniref:Uncharacterized protein n=1 Tax=Nocardia vermiculata TaxID=257274 RepID=A0A846Y803_9NOCA|nr:hypothetical protein [Nocardia vermiculata]NKY53934.1 hypothetical protein [Nocardia vermiculata]